MTTKATPNKSHHNKTVRLYSGFWKESDGLGRLLSGVYKHINGKPVFEFVTPDGFTQVFARNEWVVIDEKLSAWIEDYRDRLRTGKQMPSDYDAGYCDCLLAVIRHSLMN